VVVALQADQALHVPQQLGPGRDDPGQLYESSHLLTGNPVVVLIPSEEALAKLRNEAAWSVIAQRSNKMGWSLGKTSGFEYQGLPTKVHADGNNVAWTCPNCGHPVLFVYGNGRIGSSPQKPTRCGGCPMTYHLEPAYSKPEPEASVPPASVMRIL
jgi:hypothetical protein